MKENSSDKLLNNLLEKISTKNLSSESLEHFIQYHLKLDVPEHQRRWIGELSSSNEDLIVLAPRAHGKTTVFCRAYPEHYTLTRANRRVLIISKTHSQAEKSLDLIEHDLTRNADILADFNDELADFRRKHNMLFFQPNESNA